MASAPEYFVTYPNASIAAIVISEYRTVTSVSPYTRTISRGRYPITNPASTADTRMPVPVADR